MDKELNELKSIRNELITKRDEQKSIDNMIYYESEIERIDQKIKNLKDSVND